MAMSNTAKLCAMVITLCIITPLGIGFIMPSSVTQETTYTPDQSSNITNDIRNAESNYYADYYGEMNNAGWGILYHGLWDGMKAIQTGMEPVTSVHNVKSTVYPSGFPEPTPYSPFIKTRVTPEGLSANLYYSMEYTGTGATKLSLEKYVNGSVAETTTGITWAVYVGADNKLILDGVELQPDYSDDTTYYKVITDNISDTIFTKYTKQPQNYVVVTEGFNVIEGESTYWRNGYENSEAVFNMIIEPNCSFSIGGVNVNRSASGLLTVEYNGDSRSIGNYANFSMVFNEEGVIVMGLSAGDLAANPYARAVYTLELFDWQPLQIPFEKISLTGTNTENGDDDLLRIYCYSSAIKAGSYASTVDKSLDMSGYWEGMKGYTFRFSNGTTIGLDAALTVAGFTFDLYPKTATIVYNGISYNLTGTTITIVNDGVKFYGYLNSVDISEELDQSSWTDVELSGHWGSIGMSAARMIGNNSDQFNWLAGSFNMSVKEFAGIGLLTSALAFVGAAFIGKRSGMKVFWLLVTTGCVSAVYLVLFL